MGFFSRWAPLRDSFANSRGGLLFEMGFFTRWATFRDFFANSRGGLLFKRSAVVIEADDYKKKFEQDYYTNVSTTKYA